MADHTPPAETGDGEGTICPVCGGSGVDPCDLVPLYTLTPRED